MYNQDRRGGKKMLNKNDVLKLEIIDLSNEGFGVAKVDGQVVCSAEIMCARREL